MAKKYTLSLTTGEFEGLEELTVRLDQRRVNLLDQRKAINTNIRRNQEAIKILTGILARAER